MGICASREVYPEHILVFNEQSNSIYEDVPMAFTKELFMFKSGKKGSFPCPKQSC